MAICWRGRSRAGSGRGKGAVTRRLTCRPRYGVPPRPLYPRDVCPSRAGRSPSGRRQRRRGAAAARFVVVNRLADDGRTRWFPVHDPDTQPSRARPPNREANLGTRGVPGGVRDELRDDQRGTVGEAVEVSHAEDVPDDLAAELGRGRLAREGPAVRGVAGGEGLNWCSQTRHCGGTFVSSRRPACLHGETQGQAGPSTAARTVGCGGRPAPRQLPLPAG